MPATPNLQWSYISTNAFSGYPDNGVIYDAANGVSLYAPSSLPTLTHGTHAWLLVGVAVTGSWSTTLKGIFTAGTNTITSVSNMTGITVGHQIVPDGVYLPLGPTPVVTAVSGSTITFDDLSSPAGTHLTAIASGGTPTLGVDFTVSSPYPLGSLSYSVSPTAPGAVEDGQPDGTASLNHVGDGSAVSNLLGQAEGNVKISLGAAGSYVVTAEYVSADPQYNTTTSSGLSLTVV